MNVQNLILKNLIHNEEYARSTLPYLETRYFDDHIDKIVYEQIDEFISKYNTLPTREALVIELDNRKGMSDKEFMYGEFEEEPTKEEELENDNEV